MARGRKTNLANASNVTAIPLHEEPQAIHHAKAKDLRPDDLLSERELKVYDRYAAHLAMLNRLKPHYIDAFCEYCRVVIRLADARKFLDDEEWTYSSMTRNGIQFKSRPEVAQLNDDWRKWRTLVGEFGLAPAAEKGMQSGQGDLFDDFDNF
jgi:phage terminase small subunit